MQKKIIETINNELPGFNCGICGFKKCKDLAEGIIKSKIELQKCKILLQDKYKTKLEKIEKILNEYQKENTDNCNEDKIIGLIDKLEADFIIAPLPGENSCREVLFPFTRENLSVGEYIRYRPLGCPMIHFAKIISVDNGLITVIMTGPLNRVSNDSKINFKDIGICMVGGFIGIVNNNIPNIGQTVKFIPSHCMMQKVHSGVVVQVENNKVIIEGIQLSVWAKAVIN